MFGFLHNKVKSFYKRDVRQNDGIFFFIFLTFFATTNLIIEAVGL